MTKISPVVDELRNISHRLSTIVRKEDHVRKILLKIVREKEELEARRGEILQSIGVESAVEIDNH